MSENEGAEFFDEFDPLSIEKEYAESFRKLERVATQAQTKYAHQIAEQERAAFQSIAELNQLVSAQEEAIRSQIPRSEMISFQPIRVHLPDVVLAPDGREDFTYILGRLVTSGVCSLSDVGDIPFPRVVRLFEYWKKYPPAHETLISINEQLRLILSDSDQARRLVDPMPGGSNSGPPVATKQPPRGSDRGGDDAMSETAEPIPNTENSRKMKPDWNLMRLVVLAAEDSKNPGLRPMDGYSQAEVGYQAHLLIDALLARGATVQNQGHSGPSAYIASLTMDGHEFAELVRDENRWKEALAEAHRRGPVTLRVLRELLSRPQNWQKEVADVPKRREKDTMYISTNKALSFLIPGTNGAQDLRLTIWPGGPHLVPEWIRETETFKAASGDGSLKEVTPVDAGVPSPRHGLGADVDPAALSPGRTFPRWVYHATKLPQMVNGLEEAAQLGPEWSWTYIHQEYPKAKYHWSGRDKTVKSEAEEIALGGGWANNPSVFDRYRGPRPARTDDQDPLKWLEEWSVPGLTPDQRKKIEGQLLRADVAFDRSSDKDAGALTAMRQAFDGIAQVLLDAGVLTEELLRTDIPHFVWDSAIAGGWWRLASDSRQDILPEQIGRYWIWRDDNPEAQGLFRAEIRHWQAELLDVPGGSPENVGPSVEGRLSWRDLRTEFEKYTEEYDDLAADIDILRPGKWALIRAASPRVERIFKEIAARAAAKAEISLPDHGTAPWQLWLEYMWEHGWRRPEKPSAQSGPVRQVRPWHVAKRMAEEGARTLPRVFQTSAECCRDREEQEESSAATSQSRAAPGEPARNTNGPASGTTGPDSSPPGPITEESEGRSAEPMKESPGPATDWPDPSPDFSSEERRNVAVLAYAKHWGSSEAGLGRTARVDPGDLTRWKQGSLPAGSEKKARIENALRNNEPATPVASRPKNS